jgi:predicted TIM-barrel fold metal-dependent hydrolase
MVGIEKIFFGTDFPLISPQRYFKEMEESGLSKQDREKILGTNFSKLIERRGHTCLDSRKRIQPH